MNRAGTDSGAMWRRWARCLAVSSLALLAASASAATNTPFPYRVTSWQTDDGLPHNSVHALAQTHDGYLWVGTRDGLARFDGNDFVVVDDSRISGLRHAWITSLCATSDGSLWIGTDAAGVIRVRNGAVSRFNETNGLASNQIRCLLQARDGSVWIGSEGGLARYRDGQFARFHQSDGLSDNAVRALWEDRRGFLRVATRRGLSSLSPAGKWSTLDFGTNWNGNALRSVCEDRQGNLWVGSTDGLNRVGPDDPSVSGPLSGLPDRVINVVFEDHAGQLWAGTYAGLTRVVDGHGVAGPASEAVFGDLVYAIFQDREDNLWVGARDGLYRLNPARFTTFTTEEGLTRNNVMSVCEDASGTLWLGIWDGGVNALRDGKISAYASPVSAPRDSVLSLLATRDGTVWVGMDLNGGLQRIAHGRREVVPRPPGLLNSPIRVLAPDAAGALWVGTAAGLNVWREGNCAAYTVGNGLAGDSILALLPDRQGGFWIGTETGLSHEQGGAFTNFTTRDGLSQNAVDALYLDAEHTLWVGTRGGGLNRYRKGKFTAYTARQGLFSDEVYEVLEDDFGYFWMSCRRGIFRVARREFDLLDQGAIRTLTCTAFGKADGLLSVQCNGVAKPGGWKTKDGRLWFPTIRGVVAVETRIQANSNPPPVVVEQVLADRRLLHGPVGGAPSGLWNARSGDEVLNVPPGRGELEIHYAALSLQAPEKNQFKYRLDGLDADWSEPVSQTVVHYYNLAPGHYRFRVLACNNDGVWNETGATVALLLAPHLWQTWWFRALGFLACGMLMAILYRFRVARVRELERLRVDIAANLHDDVGARLTKVAMITEHVDQQTGGDAPTKTQIQALSRTTREVIQAMDEVVWTINPKNDTLDHLANYIFQYSQEYFQNTAVRCRLDMPVQLPERPISTEVRHNLFMAVKEALNNVLKHSGATEVRIALATSDEHTAITISDNGRGFAAEQVCGRGDGLSNMHERLERIGGRCTLTSTPGQGTTLVMEARL